ncbi:MAG TPA: carboxypeptidase regulatory-like domain-containing protein [Gemmatimonadales bacterium]|nr:carboxypeptidase regulatory-like domain-containing protein [Gemmatimonadales bacterium]
MLPLLCVPRAGYLVTLQVITGCTVAQALQSPGTITGRLVDEHTRLSIRGASIVLFGTTHRATSDSAGRFREDGLAPGTYVLQARSPGYAVGSWTLELADGEVLEREFELAPLPVQLDPVVVERRPSFAEQRLRAFERRRASGRGYFITEQQIQHAQPRTLADLFRNVPGVRLVCRGSSNCIIRMSRAARECRPDFVLDGFPATNSTSLDMPAAGVIGVELYRTLTETPMEFLKADNQCGTIVLWTRSGPSER